MIAGGPKVITTNTINITRFTIKAEPVDLELLVALILDLCESNENLTVESYIRIYLLSAQTKYVRN